MDERKKLFDEQTEDIFNKLVRLHKWDEQRQAVQTNGAPPAAVQTRPPRIVQALARLARREPELKQALLELEARARETAKEKPAAPPAPPPAAQPVGQFDTLPKVQIPLAPTGSEPSPPGEWERVCDTVIASKTLCALFASEPRLSDAQPRELMTLAQLADLTPDGSQLLGTQDGVTSLVLERYLLLRSMPSADALLLEYLGKVLSLYLTGGERLMRELAETADKPYWQAVIASLEDGMDYTDEADAEARAALKRWTAGRNREQLTDLQMNLGSPPRLSQTPPELVKLAWVHRHDLDETQKQATIQIVQSAPSSQQADGLRATAQTDIRRWAVALRDRLRGSADEAAELGEVEYALRLRVEVVEHLIEVRKIAKVEALRYRWPDAARLALQNRDSIGEVEKFLDEQQRKQKREADFTSDEARELYTLSQNDRQFRRFLLLRPYFEDIPFFQYLSASPLPLDITTGGQTTTTTTTQGQQPSGSQAASQPGATEAAAATVATQSDKPATTTTQTEETGATTPPSEQKTPPERTAPGSYETYGFKIERSAQDVQSGRYSTEMVFGKTHWPRTNEKPLGTILDEVYSHVGVAPSQDPTPFLSRMFARRDTEYLFRLVDAGQALFEGFMGAAWAGAASDKSKPNVAKAAEADTPTRLVIETDDLLAATAIPWEWLSFPDRSDLFIMSVRHSLVRSFRKRGRVPVKQLTPPLRLLIVVPSYSASTLEEVKKRVPMLESPFVQPSAGPPPADIMILSGDEVTEERLHSAMFDFIPHVLHFEGRVGGYFNEDDPTSGPFLYLSAQDDQTERQLPISQFQKSLGASGVQLMVIEPGPFASFYGREIGAFCRGLMAGGLPAAVAPVRQVDDGAVLEFLRVFYRALLEGLRLEVAVSRARLGLLGKGGDWTAFALFSDPVTLDKSRIIPAPEKFL